MHKARFTFTKTGDIRWISHLELMTVLRRTFARADVQLTHSEGFNPHPYLSVALPLPVGVESVCEILDVKLDAAPNDTMPAGLTQAAPGGVTFQTVTSELRQVGEIAWTKVQYAVPCAIRADDELKTMRLAMTTPPLPVERKSKSGVSIIDLTQHMHGCAFTYTGGMLAFTTLLRAREPVINPMLTIAALRQTLDGIDWQNATIRRLEVLDASFHPFIT